MKSLTKSQGELNTNARLTDEEVFEIRANAQLDVHTLADRYNVDHTTISDIIKYRTWQHLDPKGAEAAKQLMPEKGFVSSFADPETVLEILTMPDDEYKVIGPTELGRRYGCACCTIMHIRAGRIHREVAIRENNNDSMVI